MRKTKYSLTWKEQTQFLRENECIPMREMEHYLRYPIYHLHLLQTNGHALRGILNSNDNRTFCSNLKSKIYAVHNEKESKKDSKESISNRSLQTYRI